jgi:hypothetical protein
MHVVVKVNSTEVVRQDVDRFTAMHIAKKLHREHDIDGLNSSGVRAIVYVEGVPSRMNDESFLLRPEVYDDFFFSNVMNG